MHPKYAGKILVETNIAGKNVVKMVTCLMETVIHPIICMLETWFLYQTIATVYVNLLRCTTDM